MFNYIEDLSPLVIQYIEDNYDLTTFTGEYEDLVLAIFDTLKNEDIFDKKVSEKEAKQRLSDNWRFIPSICEFYELDSEDFIYGDAQELELAMRLYMLQFAICEVIETEYNIS